MRTLALLDEAHDTTRFDCGNIELDTWLQHQALRAQLAGTARTYVWADERTVEAYVSIAPTQVTRAEVPRSMSGGYSLIPAYLIAKLAVDRSLHGRGLGAELLVDALEIIVTVADDAGGRLIVVDAIDDSAHSFYLHHDFQPIVGSRRLVMKVATARAALDPMRQP